MRVRFGMGDLSTTCGANPCGWTDVFSVGPDCMTYLNCVNAAVPGSMNSTNAELGTILGTCTVDPTAPIGSQCASVGGVAQTIGGQVSSTTGNVTLGLVNGLISNPVFVALLALGVILLVTKK